MSAPSQVDVKTTKHLNQVGVEKVELIGEILFGPANVQGGSGLDDHELIPLAKEVFEGKRFCIVRHWILLDVMLPMTKERALKTQGLKGTILYAQQVVFDSEERYQPGNSILSDFQYDFDGCIFECENMLYILAGRGARKHASFPAVEALGEAVCLALEGVQAIS